MSNIRRARRTDTNQADIVKILRKSGIKVHITNAEWDLTLQYGGMTMLAEVRPAKGGVQKARKGRQEKFQREFCVRWIRTAEDALEAVRVIRRWAELVSRGLTQPPVRDEPMQLSGRDWTVDFELISQQMLSQLRSKSRARSRA